MTPLFTKPNLKDHPALLVLNAPPGFATELAGLSGVDIIRTVSKISPISFALIFVQTLREVEAAAAQVLAKAPGDPVIWFAYPKSTSRQFECEFNRDTGWAAVQAAGFDSVRVVSMDTDWTALRFRRLGFIKSGSARKKTNNP